MVDHFEKVNKILQIQHFNPSSYQNNHFAMNFIPINVIKSETMNESCEQEQKEKDITESYKLRYPKCAKCRNHGIISDKKGHKNFCFYETCKCNKCILINERREVLRQQIYARRYWDKCYKKGAQI